METNLYAINVTDPARTTYCGGNTGDQSGDDTESCVQLAAIPGIDDAFVLFDSKQPTADGLRFTGSELKKFVTRFAKERNISL